MRLAQAATRFNQVPLDGWNGTSWDVGVVRGTLEPFDRFISAQDFKLKDRVLLVGGADAIPAQYAAIRLPTGDVYLVSALNPDIDGNGVYNRAYLIRRAAFQAQVIKFVTVNKASGVPGSKSESVLGTYYCDIERTASIASAELPGAVYATFTVFLPAEAQVTGDCLLSIAGVRYEVKEVEAAMLLKVARTVRRGVAP